MSLFSDIKNKDVSVQLSTDDTDTDWDSFLGNARGGQFEQTSMWGRVKELEGWKPLRVTFSEKEMIIGGFQILARSKEFYGRIGYVSKGPVLGPQVLNRLPDIIGTMKKTARAYRIDALLVHPPDVYPEISRALEDHGFMPNMVKNLIQNATVVIDVEKDDDALFASVKRQKRQNIKRARDSGVTVREGSFEDLRSFHAFMLETCKRLGVAPNPSRIESLLLMWKIFQPAGKIRLFFAHYRGEDIAGIIAIPFGNTVNLWKFGWTGKFAELRPNDLLFWEIFKWSRNAGYRKVDLVHITADSAHESVQHGDRASSEQKTSSFFKLSWGGDVVLLPEGYVYCHNPLVKALYRPASKMVNSIPRLRRKLAGAI